MRRVGLTVLILLAIAASLWRLYWGTPEALGVLTDRSTVGAGNPEFTARAEQQAATGSGQFNPRRDVELVSRCHDEARRELSRYPHVQFDSGIDPATGYIYIHVYRNTRFVGLLAEAPAPGGSEQTSTPLMPPLSGAYTVQGVVKFATEPFGSQEYDQAQYYCDMTVDDDKTETQHVRFRPVR